MMADLVRSGEQWLYRPVLTQKETRLRPSLLTSIRCQTPKLQEKVLNPKRGNHMRHHPTQEHKVEPCRPMLIRMLSKGPGKISKLKLQRGWRPQLEKPQTLLNGPVLLTD